MKGNKIIPLTLLFLAIGYLCWDTLNTRPETEEESSSPRNYTSKNYETVYEVETELHEEFELLPNIPKNAIKGEILVHFKSKDELYDFIARSQDNGFEVDQIIDSLNVARFSFTDDAEWERLRSLPGYGDESWNYPVEIPSITGASATSFNGSSHLNNIGINEINPNWGTAVKVAVLDTGVEAHYTLNNANIYEVDLLNENSQETSSHGTAILSLLAGQEEVHGIAPAADYYVYEVLNKDGIGDAFTVAQAISYAIDNDADIISMSLGSYEDSKILQAAINLANSQGIPVIAPTGNEGSAQLFYPAAYENVIAVGSTGKNDSLSEYSNFGANIDISSPGDGLLTASSNDTIAISSGTSNSVPIITGLAAALMTETPGLSASEAIELLVEYANDKGTPGTDILYGAGIPDLERTLERIETNISDTRIADVYFRPNESNDAVLEASIQNTGNTTQYPTMLSAEINGHSAEINIPKLEPKESTSVKLCIVSSGESISVKLSINGNPNDHSPQDNSIHGKVTAP